jgi:hypothetical protein
MHAHSQTFALICCKCYYRKKGENVLDVILFFVKVVMIQMKARKLNGFEMLDYPDPSANPIHGPKKGNSGGRGGNSP